MLMNVINFFADNFWAAAAVLAGIVTPLAGAINERFNIKKFWKQVIAWVLSIIVTVGAYFAKAVNVIDPVYVTLPLLGIVVGLVSNGLYDIPTIKAWIKKLFGIDFGNIQCNVEEVMVCDVAPEHLKVVEDKPLEAEVRGTKKVVDLSVVKEPKVEEKLMDVKKITTDKVQKKPVNKKPAVKKKRSTKKTEEAKS